MSMFKDIWNLEQYDVLLEGRARKLEALKKKHQRMQQDIAALEEEINATERLEEKKAQYDEVRGHMARLREEINQMKEVNKKALANFKKQYGKEGESIYYATANKQGRDDETFEKEEADDASLEEGKNKKIIRDPRVTKLKGISREKEIEDRRKHGDQISQNAAGSMEKTKKEKKKDRRREGKKAIRNQLSESWASHTFQSQLQEADPAARDIILQQIASTDDPEEKAELEAMLANMEGPKKEVVPATPYQADGPRFSKSDKHLELKDIRARLHPELQSLNRMKRDLAGWKKRLSTLASDEQKMEIQSKMDELRNKIGHQQQVVQELQGEIERVKSEM